MKEEHRGGAASLEYSEDFKTASTGFPAFDDGAYVSVTGSVPTYEIVTFATTKDGGADKSTDLTFTGLLAVDAEGYLVWYYHLDQLEAWDFLPDHDVVIVARGQGGYDDRNELTYTTDTNAASEAITSVSEASAETKSDAAALPTQQDWVKRDSWNTTVDDDLVVGLPFTSVVAAGHQRFPLLRCPVGRRRKCEGRGRARRG